MDHTPAPSTARRVIPRLAAAATVTAALVAGGATTVRPSSPDDVVAIMHAWPKKYTGVGLVVDPPAGTVTDG